MRKASVWPVRALRKSVGRLSSADEATRRPGTSHRSPDHRQAKVGGGSCRACDPEQDQAWMEVLKLQLDRLQAVEEDLTTLERYIQEKLQPYAAQLTLLQEIPGVDWTLAA